MQASRLDSGTVTSGDVQELGQCEHRGRVDYDVRLPFVPLTLDDLIASISAFEAITYVRLAHGFWEVLSEAESYFDEPPSGARHRAIHRQSFRIGPRRYQLEGEFIQHFLDELRRIPTDDARLMFAVSMYAWPDSGRIEGIPRRPWRVAEMIGRHMPSGLPLYDALLFRRSLYSGELTGLLDALASRDLIVVGPEGTEQFAPFIGAKSAHFPIHRTKSRRNWRAIEQRLGNVIADAGGSPVVVLQAGNLAVHWSLRLRQSLPTATFLDLGQIMNIWDPALVLSRHFGQVRRSDVLRFYRSYSPHLVQGEAFGRCYDLRPARTTPVKFVEDKPVVWAGIRDELAESEALNQWANGGPALDALEETVADYLAVSDRSRVVATCSGSAALEAAAQVVSHELGRRARWVIPGYGFFSTSRGSFRDRIIVDCDDRGLIDGELVRRVPSDSYDGIVVVNPFGLVRRFKPFINLAERLGKYLIIDNAAGFSPLIEHPESPRVFETLSFHHTKPHGFGEGGCVISPPEHMDACRRLANFGAGLAVSVPGLGFNGKLSDPAAAFILQRLRLVEHWKYHYFAQARRVCFIADEAGLVPLIPNFLMLAPGQIPFLSSRALCREELENPHIVLRKYYPPEVSADECPNAHRIYRHIVNVPCHPQVASVDCQVLYELFCRLA